MQSLETKRRFGTNLAAVTLVLNFAFSPTWSSATEPLESFTLRFKPSEEAIFKPVILPSLKRIVDYYKKEFGIALTQPVEFIVSQDPKFIARMKYLIFNKRYPFKMIQKAAKKMCTLTDRGSAQATVHAIILCLRSDAPITRKWLVDDTPAWEALIAHELRHVVQRRFSGFSPMPGERHRRGPKWLAEGDARYVQFQYLNKVFGRKIGLKYYIKAAAKTNKTLDQLVSRGKVFPASAYGLAGLAGWLLIERFGEEHMQAYWKGLKRDISQEQSFKDAFGITMNTFIADVETVRRDESAALKWVARH